MNAQATLEIFVENKNNVADDSVLFSTNDARLNRTRIQVFNPRYDDMKRLLTLLGCALMTVSLAGCGGGGGDDAPDLVPVTGTVLVDGSPMQGVIVQFLAENTETKGSTSSGVTDAEGKFTLKNGQGNEGCAVGKFRVRFSRFAMPDGSEIPENSDPITAGAEEMIAEEFSNPDGSAGAVDVPAGGKTFEFKIESAKKK